MILQELRKLGPLVVVIGIGSGVLLVWKHWRRLQILILEVDSKQTASRVKLPRTESEVTGKHYYTKHMSTSWATN